MSASPVSRLDIASLAQPGILAPVPRVGRYLLFSVAQADQMGVCLALLASVADGETVVAGLGLQCLTAIGGDAAGHLPGIPGLRDMPALTGKGVTTPATPTALFCWLRGDDQGDLIHLSQHLENLLAPGFHLDRVIDAFRHGKGPNGHGRDLTGYEDGTENPKGKAALNAALVQGQGAGLDGASFAATQQWLHDFAAFEGLTSQAQDHIVGRRRSDNEELEDAPEFAHVKRTAQESFDPEAFVLRRSMPWAVGGKAGLMFVAFGKSFDAFDAQMRRMVGLDDGIVDGMFQISKPVTGANFWCPPVRNGQLDLRALALNS